MIRYKTIAQFSRESGYTEDAIRTKIRDHIWPVGEVVCRAPDGRVLIDVEGYNQWVESAAEYAPRVHAVLKSPFSTKVNAAANASNLSPPPLT